MSVTDPSGRVLGVEGLKAGDLHDANRSVRQPNVPVPMMAEKISDSIKAEARA